MLSCVMPTCLELFHRGHGLSATAVSQKARVGAADQALQLVRKSVPALCSRMTSKLRVVGGSASGVKQALELDARDIALRRAGDGLGASDAHE